MDADHDTTLYRQGTGPVANAFEKNSVEADRSWLERRRGTDAGDLGRLA